MLKKNIMAYVHQLLDQPSQWQTSQQAGPCSVPKFTSTSITVKHLLIKNKNINQSKSSLLIWHYVSYLFLLNFVLKVSSRKVNQILLQNLIQQNNMLYSGEDAFNGNLRSESVVGKGILFYVYTFRRNV